jgi:glycosyltransferase involved in cell wall biosynthesis
VVPNIVDVERFKPPVRVGDRPPVILVSRNLEPIYDNATAIRSLRLLRQSLPGVQLLIAGSGPEADNLQKLAQDLGLQSEVEFAGRVAAEDMPALYARAGIALNPSRVDNMPNSVLEALAAGIPVVSTNVGGVPFIVENEKNALLVPPGDEAAMASAMLRIFQDSALAERLTAEGRKTAESCAWPRVRETLFQVYRDALGGKISGAFQ